MFQFFNLIFSCTDNPESRCFGNFIRHASCPGLSVFQTSCRNYENVILRSPVSIVSQILDTVGINFKKSKELKILIWQLADF